jgi:hypothetical protein
MAEKDFEQQQRDQSQDEQLAALQQQQYAPSAAPYAPPPQYAPPAAPYAPPQYAPAAPPQYADASASAPAAPAQDPVAMLKQLGELKAAGVLTEEEFQAKKAQLLNQI